MPNRTTRKGVTAAKRSPKRQQPGKRPEKATAPTPPLDPSQPLANEQHERFAIEYMKDFNGTQAYLRTYDGTNAASAAAAAARLLGNGNVRARVEHMSREALAGEKVDAQKVLAGMARIAYCDIREAFDERGALKPIHQLPDDIAFSIAGIEVVESSMEQTVAGADGVPAIVSVPLYTRKLKFNDRLPALANMGKHFKLFTERTVLETPEPLKVERVDSPEAKAARTAFEKRLAACESALSR